MDMGRVDEKVNTTKRDAEPDFLDTLNSLAIAFFEELSISEMIWHTVRNTGSKLGLEDCVIYLFDHDRKVLVQSAAFGSKKVRRNEIESPIEIELGSGVVGRCAERKIPLLISDTRSEKNYILDDEDRLSELAVPLVYAGQLLGVLDSEHSDADFFSEKHLRVFLTISYMLSSKLATSNTVSELNETIANMKQSQSEIGQTNSNLKVQLDKARQLCDVKTELFNCMSHELRTPLTALIGFAEVLDANDTDTDVQEVVQLIKRSGNRLMETINSVLDYAKLDSKDVNLDYQWIHYGQEMKEIISLLEPKSNEKGVSLLLELYDEERLSGSMDKRALYRIVNNIVGNAIKYTSAGGVLCIVSASEEDVQIVVSDTGPGMSEEFLPQVFDLWKRENSGHQETKGSGLGLSITKKVVELVGGSIDMSSSEGEGTTVTVVLPKFKGLSR